MDDYEALDNFGKKLVTEVRDNALFDIRATMSGHMKSERAQRSHQQIEALLDDDGKKLLLEVATHAVDVTLHFFMTMVEANPSILLAWREKNEFVELTKVSDGLAGELYTDEGWIQQFSK